MRLGWLPSPRCWEPIAVLVFWCPKTYFFLCIHLHSDEPKRASESDRGMALKWIFSLVWPFVWNQLCPKDTRPIFPFLVWCHACISGIASSSGRNICSHQSLLALMCRWECMRVLWCKVPSCAITWMHQTVSIPMTPEPKHWGLCLPDIWPALFLVVVFSPLNAVQNLSLAF